jgi:hypothetical protein
LVICKQSFVPQTEREQAEEEEEEEEAQADNSQTKGEKEIVLEEKYLND